MQTFSAHRYQTPIKTDSRMAEEIPLVDFSDYGLDVDTEVVNIEHEKLIALGEDICGAFTQIGFCYLYNHGIPQALVGEHILVHAQALAVDCLKWREIANMRKIYMSL